LFLSQTKRRKADKIEIPVDRIRDARLAAEKDISGLRVFLLGPVLGVLAKRTRRVLIIDCEDELGIMRHLAFEGDEMDVAVEELYDIRRKEKMGTVKAVEPAIKRKLRHGNWQCPRCLRINSAKARFCTRCGEVKN